MNNYYFLAPSLPPLVLGEKPDITFEEFSDRLRFNLKKEDLKAVELLRLNFDLHNIRALLLKKPLDPYGNLSEKELDEALLAKDHLPEYVFAFLDQFEEDKAKARSFFGLLSRYYAEEIPKQTGFLREYLVFQREMHLVLTALRAKRAHRSVERELQFEDFTDPLVAHILAQKDAQDYDPPLEYQDLKHRFDSCGPDPWEQYRTIVQYEFEKIEEMTSDPLFSLDWILGYMVRLILVNRWNLLDSEKGEEIVKSYKTG